MIVGHLAPGTSIIGGIEPIILRTVLALGLVLSVILIGIVSLAYSRRPRRSTLLIVLALGTLFINSALGISMLVGVLPRTLHHLGEHTLVVVQALLVLTAVYYARTVERRYDEDTPNDE